MYFRQMNKVSRMVLQKDYSNDKLKNIIAKIGEILESGSPMRNYLQGAIKNDRACAKAVTLERGRGTKEKQ